MGRAPEQLKANPWDTKSRVPKYNVKQDVRLPKVDCGPYRVRSRLGADLRAGAACLGLLYRNEVNSAGTIDPVVIGSGDEASLLIALGGYSSGFQRSLKPDTRKEGVFERVSRWIGGGCEVDQISGLYELAKKAFGLVSIPFRCLGDPPKLSETRELMHFGTGARVATAVAVAVAGVAVANGPAVAQGPVTGEPEMAMCISNSEAILGGESSKDLGSFGDIRDEAIVNLVKRRGLNVESVAVVGGRMLAVSTDGKGEWRTWDVSGRKPVEITGMRTNERVELVSSQRVTIFGRDYTAIQMSNGQYFLLGQGKRLIDWRNSFDLSMAEASQVFFGGEPSGGAKMIGDIQLSPVEVAQLLDIRGEVPGTVIRPIRAIVVEGAESPTLVDMPPKVSVTKNGVEVELTLNEDGEYLDMDGKKYNYSVVGQVPEGTNGLAVVEDGSGFSLWAFTKEGATEVGKINFEKQSEIPIGAELAVGEGRQVTEAEMDLVRNGVEDKRFLAMKKGFVFAFADTEGNKQVAMVVVPSQFEIGDLGDPNPNTYPQWREGPNINPADMGEIMKRAFNMITINWRATDRLVILGISDVPGNVNYQYSETTGFNVNISINGDILPNTTAHLRVTQPGDRPFAVPSQSRYLQAISEDPNYVYHDSTSYFVITSLLQMLFVDSNGVTTDFRNSLIAYENSMVGAGNSIIGGYVEYPFRLWYTGTNVY